MKKIFIAVVVFTFLLVLFLFVDEDRENLKEEILWKESPDKIVFSPPRSKKIFEKMQDSELIFMRYANWFQDTAFFTVESDDKESEKRILYECNYQCKNLFMELSVLKILSAAFAEDGYRKNLSISFENSPAISLSKNNKVLKEFYLGNESRDKSRRFFETGGKIYSTHSYIFNKFLENPIGFRELNVFPLGISKIKKIELISEEKKVQLVVNPVIENNSERNSYIRLSQKKILLDPALGDLLFTGLRDLKVDRYPDSLNGEGFLVAEELIKTKETKEIQISLSNNIQISLKVFPVTNIKEVKLRPVVRKIQNITESASYISDEFMKNIENTFDNISTAEVYVKALPKK
ncbi:MAG: DUF4340 domain-containing protein [Leptospiraceae bacterium]|nr:DUF4340 domain-containing protein [Leptospiraceae bacterium]MCK6380336.1 DUF4340 domain-containing protein [Leptospiraceae bacterium]NUM41266.1 DUF4340 domain-containing protein [Leptospiraceae bacterium]